MEETNNMLSLEVFSVLQRTRAVRFFILSARKSYLEWYYVQSWAARSENLGPHCGVRPYITESEDLHSKYSIQLFVFF